MVTVLEPYKPYKLDILERGDLYFPDGKRIKPHKARADDPHRDEWRFMVALKPKPWWIPEVFKESYFDRFGRYMIIMVPPEGWKPYIPPQAKQKLKEEPSRKPRFKSRFKDAEKREKQ